MVSELSRAIEQLTKEKGIPREILVEALEKSILAAARKKYGPNTDIEAQFNEDLGEVELFEFRTVVEEITDAETQILSADARDLDPGALLGDSLGMKMNLDDFGRIAAQTAKQVLLQHMRDAEREHVYNEYKDRKDELITGTVRRFERGSIIVDLGRVEAIIPPREQMDKSESYRPGDRIQAFVLDVLRTARGPQIVLSRTHPGLLRKLFEMEVPEIFEGVVRVEAAVREPGFRAKIAVTSTDSDVDPVGACVGLKGSRVQAVVQELRGEKIDIIPWSLDPARFVCNAIAPAVVTKVLVDEETRSMELIVPDDQLSLAIGRKGQNVRLAAQLTGWRLDIVSESKLSEMNARAREELKVVDGLSETLAEIVIRHGYRSMEDISDAEVEELVDVLGIDEERAARIIQSCEQLLEQRALEEMKARGVDTDALQARIQANLERRTRRGDSSDEEDSDDEWNDEGEDE